jgi:hypothetical protein
MSTGNENPLGNPKVRPYSPDTAARAEGEFDRFSNLAAKLVRVSKRDLDANRASDVQRPVSAE